MLNALLLSLAMSSAPEAAAEIAKQPRVEIGAVSYDGHQGATSRALEPILALDDDALPVLLEMARSSSPVARVAAAAGLVQIAPTHAALRALAKDGAAVDVTRGCITSRTTVRDAVAYLKKYGA